MKSTSLARQAVMHDVCNAPGGADCPTNECGKCLFRRDPVIQKTRKNKMTNQLMLAQVRLVYEYLCDEADRCKGKSALLSLLSHQHILETARNGLFMVIRDTLGEGYDEEEKKTYPEGVPLAAMPKEAREICEDFDKKAAEAANEVFASEEKKEAEIFGYPVADWKRVLDENSVDCPGKLAAFLEGFEKYRRVVRNHGIKNGHEELDECLSILDEKQSDEEKKEAEIFGYPVADWKRVLDENSVDCPGKLAAFLEGFEKYRRVVRNHGIKNGHEELDECLSILDEKQSDCKKKEA